MRFESLYRRLVIACGLPLLLAAQIAHALPAEFAVEQVRARLIPAVAKVHPGEEITVGLQQKIIPHWHTYWQNPGDSGTATAIAWTLPPGATAGEIRWPIPSRFTLGHVTNYGYANEVTLLSRIKVPADAKPGGRFAFSARINLLVCEEVCIPHTINLGLTLPVVAAGTPRGPVHPVIQQAEASLPVASPWRLEAEQRGKALVLRIAAPELLNSNVKDVWFYAAEWGKVAHGAPQPLQREGQGVALDLTPGEAPLNAGERLKGTLVVTESTGAGTEKHARGFDVDVPLAAHAGASHTGDTSLAMALLLALVGGIILNLMPCVFPVLSIKALALLRHADGDARHARLHGLVYTTGILASFAALAILLIVLKLAGAQLGWGFQFQAPLFVLAMAWLMFMVGLNLSGVFEIGASITHVGSSLATRHGYAGSFFTGVLATIVATPCTAPFMGVALGYALTQPPLVLLSVFLSLGLGLALPYLLVSAWPRLQRLLPKPGAWMETFRQFLAFPMYATAAWLVWVLAQQAGVNSVAVALGGMLLLALAAWVFARTRRLQTDTRRAVSVGIAIAVVALLFAAKAAIDISAEQARASVAVATPSAEKNWTSWSPQRLKELRDANTPAFVNMTAAWCITCLVNERVALSNENVVAAFTERGIVYLKGDWTNEDPQITAFLKEFGRSGVPLYVYYPVGGKPQILPQILTPDIVISAITEKPQL